MYNSGWHTCVAINDISVHNLVPNSCNYSNCVSIVTPVLNESHSDYTELPKVLANLIHVFIFMKYEIRKHAFIDLWYTTCKTAVSEYKNELA